MEQYQQDSIKRTARLAGVCYALMGIVALLGIYHAPLVNPDINALARALAASESHFRFKVVADVLSVALAVPLGVLLYELFKAVNRRQAALLALWLMIAAPISFVVALNYVAAQWLLSDAPIVATIAGAERQSLSRLFLGLHRHGVLAVEIFWGLWLLPFGLLVIRSRLLPRVLGILLIIGGVAYVAHSITSLLLGANHFLVYERITMLARAAAEFPTMLWLLIKGADTQQMKSGAV